MTASFKKDVSTRQPGTTLAVHVVTHNTTHLTATHVALTTERTHAPASGGLAVLGAVTRDGGQRVHQRLVFGLLRRQDPVAFLFLRLAPLNAQQRHSLAQLQHKTRAMTSPWLLLL